MEQTITIEIPKGKAVTKVVHPDGSIVISFKDKEPIRSKSLEEFCKNHPVTCTEYYICNGHIESPASTMPRSIGIRTTTTGFLETKEDAEGILALIQLTRLHDEWVEGSDYKEYAQKAYIYMTKKIKNTDLTPEISVGTSHHLLDFPTSEMARDFLNYFEDLILKAKKFL